MHSLFLLLVSLVLISCSTGGIKERQELKKFYSTGALDEGLQFLDTSKYFNEKNEHLLFLLEKGMFFHAKGDYSQSNLIFDEAKSLIREQYTIRISKKIEKSLMNDNYDLFYGEFYEHSMVYFYSALNSILLSQKDSSREALFKARADILAWDSYLKSIEVERLGKSVYKKDLLLKIFGAKIHELVNTKEDLQIALLLYRDAYDVLLKNYNSYPAMNSKFQDFRKDFEKLSSLKVDEIKKNYIEETNHQKQLKIFLEENINRLTMKKKNKKEKELITLVFEKGLIAEKAAEKIQFGMEGLSHDPYISLFVADVLGLLPMPNDYNPSGVYSGMATASVAMKLFSFSLEIPKIMKHEIPKEVIVNIKDNSGNSVLKKNTYLINPMSDIAEEAILESATSIYTRTGARLATKHIAAIMASFATFKALGGGTQKESSFARSAAVLQYAAATRLIESSEKADTRFWSTLPGSIHLVDLELDPGEYEVVVEEDGGEGASLTSSLSLGKVVITKNNLKKLMSFRLK